MVSSGDEGGGMRDYTLAVFKARLVGRHDGGCSLKIRIGCWLSTNVLAQAVHPALLL